ncbi:MAG: ABC transporter permease subunit [Planctomycetes bacterium]|nr:ABC transporter permease subunit [Planctomycetota bacterium]
MPTQILTIARVTLIECLRQPVTFVLVMLCGFMQYLNTWQAGFSMGSTTGAEVSGDNKLLLDIGLSTVFVCGMLLAAFLATSAIAREIENKTILTIVSKPISRTAVVLGKYVGVSGAVLVAVLTMLLFLLMGIRHGVMSTAADKLDGPVLVFTFSAVTLSLLLAATANYWYGWSFAQTALLAMLPAMIVAYGLVVFIGKDWNLQPLYHNEYLRNEIWWAQDKYIDRFPQQGFEGYPHRRIYETFKPQITVAAYSLTLAILVLCAIATAVSTRLGQIMTIVVCSGVFLFGLLSNHLLGRNAFVNTPVSQVMQVDFPDPRRTDLSGRGDTCTVEIKPDAQITPSVGDSIYWGPNPNGLGLATGAHQAFTGDPADDGDLFSENTAPNVIVTHIEGETLTIRNIGLRPARVARPPGIGDYVFLAPTRVNLVSATAWAVIPNMHFFWLIDAVSQNVPVPFGHVAMITGYTATQAVAFLALGVLLFQRRDV